MRDGQGTGPTRVGRGKPEGGGLRIAACAANDAGIELVDFITQQRHPLQFIATCRADRRSCEEKIARTALDRGFRVLRDVSANDPEFVERIKAESIDLMLLLWWPEIIRRDAVAAATVGWVNNHPSLLPFNQGKHGYVWSIIDGTPYGVSIHLIDEQIDRGPILFQKEIAVEITDTGESLYRKGYREQIDLFKAHYADIVTLNFAPKAQDPHSSTYHDSREIAKVDRIDLERLYRAGELIDLIRARTFAEGPCSYIVHKGRRYHLKLKIEPVTDGKES
jgi:methionyl-tRNA formyltransferase